MRFCVFQAALSEQLNSDGNAETHGRTMESAERLYDKLIEVHVALCVGCGGGVGCGGIGLRM